MRPCFGGGGSLLLFCSACQYRTELPLFVCPSRPEISIGYSPCTAPPHFLTHTNIPPLFLSPLHASVSAASPCFRLAGPLLLLSLGRLARPVTLACRTAKKRGLVLSWRFWRGGEPVDIRCFYSPRMNRRCDSDRTEVEEPRQLSSPTKMTTSKTTSTESTMKIARPSTRVLRARRMRRKKRTTTITNAPENLIASPPGSPPPMLNEKILRLMSHMTITTGAQDIRRKGLV